MLQSDGTLIPRFTIILSCSIIVLFEGLYNQLDYNNIISGNRCSTEEACGLTYMLVEDRVSLGEIVKNRVKHVDDYLERFQKDVIGLLKT